MNTWQCRLNAQDWSPETFHHEIWEGKPWHWHYGKKLAEIRSISRGGAENAESKAEFFLNNPSSASHLRVNSSKP